MLGTVDHIDYDGEHVRHVELRFPSRADPSGEVVMNVETLERIGRGSFGTVYRARCTHHPKLALKISTGKATRLRLELEVLAKVCTKGRLLLPRFEFGALNKSADLMVVGMELCVPSTLHDFLLSTKLTHEADLLFMAHQAAQAVAYVHEDGCIHRDVKLQNFVFDQLGNLKLIDFGLASNTMEPSAGDVVAGTVSFMPPEMAHNALHRDRRVSVGAAGDVWSMGIVFFSIFTQRNPYAAATAELEAARRLARSRSRSNANNVGGEGEDASATSAKATQNPVEANHQLLDVVRQAKWRWPDGCRLSADVRKLVESILIMDAKQRPTVAEVLKSTVWRRRSRTPPAAVVNYLGITDDMFFSADDAPLLRAVEQRSADVAASLANNRPHPTEGDGHEKDAQDEDDAVTKRGSLQVVATDSADVHVYDVRCSARKTSKPIRDISKVIEEETSKPANKTRSRSRRARGNNTSSTSRGASMRRRESEDDDDDEDDDEDDTEEAVRSLQASLTEELLMTQNTSRPTSRSASASRLAHETTGVRSAATASTPPRNDRSNSDEVSAANVYDDEKAALPRSLSGSICLVAENEDDDDAHAHLQIASTSAPPPLKISIAATTMDHHPEDASARMSLHDPFAQACTSSLPAVANRTTSPGMSFNTKKHVPSQRPNKTTITNNKPSSSSSSFKPFSAAVPHNMAMTDLLLDEIAARMELGGVLFLEHQWLLASLRLTIEEDQERYNITWLAEEQAKSASHPHHFKELRDITNTKKYRFGFVCDLCDYEFLPTTDRQRRLKLHFFHCACGRDLCPECYEDFRQSCTCVCCEEVHLNHHVLREHLKKTMLPRVSATSGGRRSVAAAAVAPAPPGSRKAPPPRNRKRRGDDDDDEEDFEDSDADEVEEPQQRPRQLPRAAAAKAQASPPTKLSLAAMRQQRQPAASASTPTPTPPPAQDRRAAQKRERESGGFDRPIDVPDGPWRPFDRHRDEGRPTPLQPTAEERERLLNGEWIRYSYLYTNTGEGVMQDTDDSEPVALVYHIQPGRHGAIFLSSGYSMHSAILSMMSRQLFVVDRADVGTGEDATRLSTLVAAKSHADLAPAFHTLHAIVGHDSNMMKQRRVPGRVSVYQAPRSAYSCGRGDPFVYVRWFRFNEDRSIGAFLLSNGAMQVLVGDEYELRWFEDERRYLVRCNGVCEVVDEERFPLAEEINHLLYDALDGENEEGSAGSSEFQ